MRFPQPSARGLTTTRYGNGLESLVVMGGIWSLSRLTTLKIFKAAFWSIFPIALRTLARSVTRLARVAPEKKDQQSVHTGLSTRCCDGDIKCPNLPAYLFLAFARQPAKPMPRATSLFLVELNCDPPSHAPTPTGNLAILPTGRGRQMLSDQSRYARFNQCL
jgi:hypothetical protein